MRQALTGVRVVEVSQDAAGAYCGKVFADLGADVVKVESPDGDPAQRSSGRFLHLNTNKRSVVCDAEDPASRARVEALLARADLVVQSRHAGDLAALGSSTAAVRQADPALVVATISGFGETGPYADYKWTDLIAQMYSWYAYPQGLSLQRPVKLPGMVALAAVGHTAAVGALAALLRADATGVGAAIDCAAVEALGSIPSRVGRYLGWEYNGRFDAPPVATSTSGTLIPTGVFPCGDGFVSMMSTPQQLGEMLDVLDDDDLRAAFERPDAFMRGDTKEILDAALYPWLLSHTRAELTAAAQAKGWPFAGLYSPSEVREADHLHQRGFWVDVEDPRVGHVQLAGAPYRHAEGGWRLRHRAPALGEHEAAIDAELASPKGAKDRSGSQQDETAPPLRGVRVLDLTTVWSGPYLTLLLADLGAEVIRVENPSVFPPTTKGYLPRPSDTMVLGSYLSAYAPPVPGRPDRPYNRHAMNNSLARNKLSCTLDPRRPEARELFLRLVDESDVFVENLKASTLHRMGIQEDELLDRNPRLIVLRIPPAGLSGDWAGYTGFGAQFDGLTGLAYLTGHHDSELVETPPTTTMDASTGPAGAFAILAALRYREATGRGQVIEMAQMENVLAQLGDVYLDEQLGVTAVRRGNRDAPWAPQGTYRCNDEARFVGISVTTDEEWIALTSVIGRPDLASDARLSTAEGRHANHDEIDGHIELWTSQQDPLQAFATLQAAGIPAAPQLEDAMLVEDPQVKERGWLRTLDSAEVGSFPHIGHAYRGLPLVWERGAPALGEDNEYVFKKLLHLDDQDYERLVADQVIVEDYLDADGVPY